jgi:hypothetical protein
MSDPLGATAVPIAGDDSEARLCQHGIRTAAIAGPPPQNGSRWSPGVLGLGSGAQPPLTTAREGIWPFCKLRPGASRS